MSFCTTLCTITMSDRLNKVLGVLQQTASGPRTLQISMSFLPKSDVARSSIASH